jgi:ATP-binding cassette subfamily B protein
VTGTADDAALPDAAPKRSRGEQWKALGNVRPLLAMVWRTSPALALASASCRLLRAAVPLATLYVGKLIIDALVRAVGSGAIDRRQVLALVLLEMALAVAFDFLARGAALADGLLGDRFSNRINLQMMRHAALLDLAQLEDPEIHDRMERARQQTLGRVQLMTQVMGLMQDLVTLAFLASAMILFSPLLLLLLICALVPSFLGETHFASLSYSFLYRWTPQRRALEYFRWLGTAPESASETKIFGLGDYFRERYRRLADAYGEQNRALALRRAAAGAALASIGIAGYYAAYAVMVLRTLAGALSVGDLTFLAGSFARCRRLVENMLQASSAIVEQALYLDDLFAFFRLEPRLRSKANAVPAPRPMREGIEFRGVSFRYPGAAHDAVSDLNFVLRRGERVALVGENGAGKTTIVKLLTRLYEPTEGRILLDAIDLREYALEDWWREIGVIFQNFMRYNMLLGENIGVGRIEHIADRRRIERAAELGLAAEVAARMSAGFDQMIGRRFAGGADLSGGEWQKIALSRAYMRDAQLVILDEPTAALDARAEHAAFERFAALARGRTALLISHRFSTVRMAERILVLHEGRLLEGGTHQELLALGGRYAFPAPGRGLPMKGSIGSAAPPPPRPGRGRRGALRLALLLALAAAAAPAAAQDCQEACLAACPKHPGPFGTPELDRNCAVNCLNLSCDGPQQGTPGVPPGVPRSDAAPELIVTGVTPFRALSRGAFAITAAALPRGGSFAWRLKTEAVELVDEHKPSHGIFTLPQHGPGDAEASERRVVPLRPGQVEITVDYTVQGRTVSQSVNLDILPPLLFLHGIASNAATWDAMKRRLEEIGLLFGGKFCATCPPPADGDFYTADFLYPQESYIRQKGEVAAWIATITAHVPSEASPDGKRVALVAHSMGGLAARAYLQDPGYRGDVAALVTVGTPHRGSIAGQFAYPVIEGGAAPPFIDEELYRNYWVPLLEGGERPVKAVLKWLMSRYGHVDLSLTSEGVRELAIVSDDMKALDRDAARTLPRNLRYVFVIGTLPHEVAEEILSQPEVKALGLLERNNTVFTTLKGLLERTDVLVDEGSQNLNTLVPNLGEVIRTPAIHCCWAEGYHGGPLNETDQTDVILRALKATGLFGALAR